MVFAIVPAAPPARKKFLATSCPAPISTMVPYLQLSRLIYKDQEGLNSCIVKNQAVLEGEHVRIKKDKNRCPIEELSIIMLFIISTVIAKTCKTPP